MRLLESIDLCFSPTGGPGQLEEIVVHYDSGPPETRRRGRHWKSNARTDVLVAALALLVLRARRSPELAKLDSRNGPGEADLCAKLHDLWHSPRKRVESHWLDAVFDEGTEELPSPLGRLLSRNGGRKSAIIRFAEGLGPHSVAFRRGPKPYPAPGLWEFVEERFGIPRPEPDLPPRLPSYRTSLVGRDRDIETLLAAVGENRLVTLIGPSGVGKTRLAIEVARRVTGFPGSPRLVDLSSARSTEQVIQLVLELFPGSRSGQEVSLGLVGEQFREVEMLLLLDNCETALTGACAVAGAILEASTGVSVLATALEPLHAHGEFCYALAPLPVPEPATPYSVALESPAVRLFLDRAIATQASFETDESSLRSVLDVCRVVDGLPLGIELAASAVRHFSTDDLAGFLLDPTDIIRATDRSLPARHESLRSVFDWTYGLLSEEEKRVLICLSYFPSDWVPVTAVSICMASGVERRAAWDGYRRLVDLSIVRTRSSGREMVPDPLRVFAREKRASLPDGERIPIAFEEQFLSQVEQKIVDENQAPFSWLPEDRSNLQFAALSALEHGRAETAIRFVEALYPYWLASGAWADGHEICSRILATAELSPQEELRVLHPVAGLEFRLGSIAAARAHYERSRTLAIGREDTRSLAHALHGLGTIAFRTDRLEEAEAHFTTAASAWAEQGAETNLLSALNNLAAIAATQGRYEQASEHFQSVLEMAARSGEKRTLASALTNFGLMRWRMADGEGASAYFLRSLEILEGLGDPWGEANVANNLGVILLSAGDATRSAVYHGRSLRIRQRLEDMAGIAASLEGIASLALAQDDPGLALRLIVAARGLRRERELGLTDENRRAVDRAEQDARDHLGTEGASREQRLAQTWSFGEAVDAALEVTPPA